jgi:hypothetical protein
MFVVHAARQATLLHDRPTCCTEQSWCC